MKVIPTVTDDLPAWVQRDLSKLSNARRKTLVNFIREQKLKGASPNTILSYVRAIKTLSNNGKSYEKLREGDLIPWMEWLGSNGWSKGTVNLFRVRVKSFLRALHGCSWRDPSPEFLKCICRMRSKRELPKNILSRAEIRQLVDACENQRDRALVFTTYESGGRAGEVLGAKIENLQFDEFGGVLHLAPGKTGERRVRLVESVPDLRLWISMHPDKNNPEAALWPHQKRDKEAIGIMGFHFLLKKLQEKTGINKHIYPHLLRHSRATHLSAGILTEAQMRIYFGWSKSSRMPDVYTHLSGRDVDSTLLRHYGIKVGPPTEDKLEPKTCPWCKVFNSPSARFCQQCNAPLDPTSASKVMERQRRRLELVERFIERVLQEVPEKGENILREMRKELSEVA